MEIVAGPRGADVIAELKAAGVFHIAALPDKLTSEALLWPISRDADFKLIRLCKEDEGVSICAALSFCGKRAALLMQYTGLFDSINAVRGIAVEYQLPVVMLVGLLGKEPELSPRQSRRYGIRIVEPVLETMEIDHFCIEGPEHVGWLRPAIDRAYQESRPLTVLFGRSPVV